MSGDIPTPWPSSMVRESTNDTSLSAELEQSAGRIAELLRETGLRRGDTVLVFHPMSAELYMVLTRDLSAGSGGHVRGSVDRARAHRTQLCIATSRGMIASAKAHLLRFVSPALRKIPFKFTVGARVPGTVSLKAADRLTRLGTIEPCSPDDPRSGHFHQRQRWSTEGGTRVLTGFCWLSTTRSSRA